MKSIVAMSLLWIVFIIIIVGNCQGQDVRLDTNGNVLSSGKFSFTTMPYMLWARIDSLTLIGRRIRESHNIVFHSPGGKKFFIDFAGDTMSTSGDMEIDSAARMFVDYLAEAYAVRIAELKADAKRWRELAEDQYRIIDGILKRSGVVGGER